MVKAVFGQRGDPAANRVSVRSAALALQTRAVHKVPVSVVWFSFEEISLLCGRHGMAW